MDHAISAYGTPKFIKIDVEGYELEVLKGLNQPIDMISFEYTTPEQTVKAVACIDRLAVINRNVRFNYSVGESMEFLLRDWIGKDEMLQLVSSPKFIQTGFGDIYARNS